MLAIGQAICQYRTYQGIDGRLFLGIDTHSLSVPACASALEVLAASGIDVMFVSEVVDPTFRFMTLDWDGRTAWPGRRPARCSGWSA